MDNCLGSDCPDIEDCFFAKARREAQEAELLVINHHLFFADMAIRETGFAELLPGAEAIILDEAHQLPEIASFFFGKSLSHWQLLELARDTMVEQARDAADFPDLRERAAALETAAAVMREALGPADRRAQWREVSEQPSVLNAVANLALTLDALQKALQEAAQRGKGLESCYRRCEDSMQRWILLAEAPGPPEQVRWFETRGRGFIFTSTPLDVAPTFQGRMAAQPGAWIFTSATLAVGPSFEHFAARLGLTDYAALRLDSPFDFARNALLYHPPELPDPAASHYTTALLNAVLPVLNASQGRAFLLFTSYRALREAADWLAERLPYPLLVQGALPKAGAFAAVPRFGQCGVAGDGQFLGRGGCAR